MYYDPRSHDEFHLRNIADSARERSTKTGVAAMPTLVLIWLVPFLLIIRGFRWGWSRLKR